MADLVAFIDQMRDVPGYAEKSITDIRLGARMVLRQLALDPTIRWDLDTVKEWTDEYANTPHADKVSPATVVMYQDRLRAAVRIFHKAHTAQPQAALTTLVFAEIRLTLQTMRDVELLAAAWGIAHSEAVARLVDFYRDHATADTSTRKRRKPRNRFGRQRCWPTQACACHTEPVPARP